MIGKYFIKTDSSCVKAVRFIPHMRALDVEFPSGHLYRYFNVPYKVYAKLLASDSLGRFFTSHIRNDYSFSKLK